MVFSESIETADSEGILHSSPSMALAVDLHVGGAYHSPVDVFLEDLIAWAVRRCGIEEFVKAKEEFFQLTGKVFYDDETYHSRMHYFLEYFLFERTFNSSGRLRVGATPFEAFLESSAETVISGFTHSLFAVIRIQNQALTLKDIFSAHKYRIQKQSEELFKGISKGDIFQGFVFHLEEHSVLSRGLIFHPARAHRLLKKSIKEEKNRGFWNPNQMLAKLARQQLKLARLKHVDPKLVYMDSSG